ncbi:MAG: immunoglobulin domain-containing protein, partial [Bacteroidetes bacterium]|nr:immunoglobulin domain-containing protein [Bacteroidota bacterium]
MKKPFTFFTFIFLFLWASHAEAQYCLPTYSVACSSDDYINNFSTTLGLSNITNNNTGCNGAAPNNFTFFSSMVVSQVQGQSFNFSVQSGSSWSQGFRIWVDWNQNGTFGDPGEAVWVSPSTGTGVYTGTINVPVTALPGNTHLRVMCRYATIPAATDYCSTTLSFGETEDYVMNVVSATPCSGKPNTGTISQIGSCPSYLSLTGATIQANISVQWQSRLTCGGTWANIPGATQWSYSLPTFNQSTQFRVFFVCNNSNQSDTSAPITIASVAGCYCTSSATINADEDIFNVTLGTLNNTSNCASVGPGPGSVNSLYSNYTTLTPPDLLKGSTYSFSVTVGYCGSVAYSNVAAIYIDFNQNGVYTDPGENVYLSAYGAGTVAAGRLLTGSFTVPTNAASGKTGMRVVAVESSTVSPCGTYSYGETEDYLVNILYSPNVTGTGLVNYQGTYCAGANVTLTASAPGYTNPKFVWKKPNGTWDTSTTLTINNIQPSQGGNYLVYMLSNACPGNPPDSSYPRLVQLTVNPIPPMPTVASVITYCQNDPFDSIHADGVNLKWYTVPSGGVAGPNPMINTSIGGTYTFYVSQTIDGCESPRKQVTVTVSPKPPMPTATSPVGYCQGDPSIPLSAQGQNLRWYSVATGGAGTPIAPTPSTQGQGSTTWYVTQTIDG